MWWKAPAPAALIQPIGARFGYQTTVLLATSGRRAGVSCRAGFFVTWKRITALDQRGVKIDVSRFAASALAIRTSGARPMRTAPVAIARSSGRSGNVLDVRRYRRRRVSLAPDPKNLTSET